jgi:4-aminobutyrate aminotransferase-like enzyme
VAARIGRSVLGPAGRLVDADVFEGEPEAIASDIVIARESETLGRTGRWFASTAWRRAPAMIVVGEALALGSPFGAVLARGSLEPDPRLVESAAEPIGKETLARVAATIRTVEREGLLQQGRALAEYLRERLEAVRETCAEIKDIAALGLCFRIALAAPLSAKLVRRRMCERGVLVGVDEAGRVAIEPPLAMRIAEADVITGALRGAILDLPVVTASACCAACAADRADGEV